jgi:SPP1 gp7 family putative phage head morphogenesis protein
MSIERQRIPEALYRNAINLNRYENGVAKKIVNAYNDIIVQITDELKKFDAGDLTLTPAALNRQRTILLQLQESLATWADQSALTTTAELQGLAELQSVFVQEQLRKVLPSDAAKNAVRTVEISPQFARSVVETDPRQINVFTLPEEFTVQTGVIPKFSITARDGAVINLPNGVNVRTAFRRIAESQTELFQSTVRTGLLANQTTQQISKQLRGKLNFEETGTLNQIKAKGGLGTVIPNNQIDTIIRTSINQVSNTAINSVFKANADMIDRYKYVATLDSRTSAICGRLDGQVFEMGKGPQPPQHFNCRSTIVPIIKDAFLDQFGLDQDDLTEGLQRPSKTGLSDRGKLVPANENYAVWLSKQDVATQNKVFGIEKSKIYREQLKTKNPTDVFRTFVRSDGTTLTLEELGKANAT